MTEVLDGDTDMFNVCRVHGRLYHVRCSKVADQFLRRGCGGDGPCDDLLLDGPEPA